MATGLHDRVSIVIVTRDRCADLLRTLDRLAGFAPDVSIAVVDNASTDGTADAVTNAYPDVDVVRVATNLGAAGRNIGVANARTPYVAFCDDDSWWDAPSLTRAAAVLDRHRDVGAVAGRVMLEHRGVVDPVCAAMASSPLGTPGGIPGPSVLGFIACGTVVRRSAFLAAGGFPHGYGVGGEEAPLALALASDGWKLVYLDDVIAHHDPSPSRDRAARVTREIRNDVWTEWLRFRRAHAARSTIAMARRCAGNEPALRGVTEALVGLPKMWSQRRVVPPTVERDWRRVQAAS